MVSEVVIINLKIFIMEVLILIMLEYGLGDIISLNSGQIGQVLILIMLEYGLGDLMVSRSNLCE